MKRRDVLVAGAATAASGVLARPSLAQGAKVLRFVPQANLANPDPIWTTATVAYIHGYMIWDTLYGLDEKLSPKPPRYWSKYPVGRPPARGYTAARALRAKASRKASHTKLEK